MNKDPFEFGLKRDLSLWCENALKYLWKSKEYSNMVSNYDMSF